jgi:predicted DNA-binding transcriptional regulator AlpA
MTKAELHAPASEEAINRPVSTTQVDDDGLYDIEFVCAFFGGSKPLHAATVYRGIKQGRYPPPVKPSPNANRWIGRELKAAKTEILEAPRKALQAPRHRSQSI